MTTHINLFLRDKTTKKKAMLMEIYTKICILVLIPFYRHGYAEFI